MRPWFIPLCAGIAAAVGLAILLLSCTPTPKTGAEVDYLAEQLSCIDKAVTKEAATACRDAVKARWALDGGDQ